MNECVVCSWNWYPDLLKCFTELSISCNLNTALSFSPADWENIMESLRILWFFSRNVKYQTIDYLSSCGLPSICFSCLQPQALNQVRKFEWCFILLKIFTIFSMNISMVLFWDDLLALLLQTVCTASNYGNFHLVYLFPKHFVRGYTFNFHIYRNSILSKANVFVVASDFMSAMMYLD